MKQFFTISFLLFLLYLSAHNYLPAQSLKSTKPAPGLNKSAAITSKSDKTINFNGQWKGGFSDNSMGFIGYGGNKIDYVLEIECRGSNVSGYSYTYFNEGAKRYYTICKLQGTLNKATKEVTVTEIERTKYNTPPEFRNCFQTHKLHFTKNSEDEETLEGTWIPAPNQTGDCGYGKTLLTRRSIKPIPLLNTKPNEVVKKNVFRDMNKEPKNPVAIKPKLPIQSRKIPVIKKPIIKEKEGIAKKDEGIKEQEPLNSSLNNHDKVIQPKFTFEKRSKALLKTIEIEQDSFKVDLYDNGEVDGDSVSVFYNNKLIVSHKKLSEKPISLTLKFDKNTNINELTMYAENLGAIPPNTALMVINDGTKRYEVRIASDTEKNGTVGFTHKAQ